jgi:hypothetical protein
LSNYFYTTQGVGVAPATGPPTYTSYAKSGGTITVSGGIIIGVA